MKVTYETTFTATCPVDGTVDVYALTVISEGLVQVEELLDAVKEIGRGDPAFQEDITQQLALMLGAFVRTEGVHSGVRTVAEASPEGGS